MLNEDLTEAIAMGHDLGHTPFGHSGENALSEIFPGGFSHNVQSLRVVDVLETNSSGRRGMNLTFEVRDGILNHTGPNLPITLEGQVVKISDRIAYINHDIDDAIRSGVLREGDLPAEAVEQLGHTTKMRIDTLIKDMIFASDGQEQIIQSEVCATAMDELRTFMFENVYFNNEVKSDDELYKIKNIICTLYEHFLEHTEELPEDYQAMIPTYGAEEMVKDQVAGMTDRYAIDTFENLYVPIGWRA
jgi:dGTPase